MMKRTFQHPFLWLLVVAFHHVAIPDSNAQSCGFSSGKTLHELQVSVHNPVQVPFNGRVQDSSKTPFLSTVLPESDNFEPKYGVFLPRWSAEDLPFFCKIEHDWAKGNNHLPVKFRLGSVDYVDWLEGKSWDKLRY